MGQKVHPYGMRLGIIRDTRSKWFAQGREYRDHLVEDLQARKIIHQRHHHAGISDILIERAAGTTTVTIESAKPGIIIGRGGADVDRLRRDLDEIMSGRVRVNVEETKSPETNAQLIAEEIASQIERRASIRRAMSQAVERAVRAGVEGIRVAVSGRLMGAEIARTERLGPIGSVPLHTLRADVDRGFSEAVTGYGHIGVQVYVCNGEILPPPPRPPASQLAAQEAEATAAAAAAQPEAPQQAEVQEGAQVGAAAAEVLQAQASAEQAAGSSAEAVAEARGEPQTEAEVAEIDLLLAEAEPGSVGARVSAEEGLAVESVEGEEATQSPSPEASETPAEEDSGDVDA